VLEFLNNSMGSLEPSRNRVVAPARQAGGIDPLKSILGLLKSLKIRALISLLYPLRFFLSVSRSIIYVSRTHWPLRHVTLIRGLKCLFLSQYLFSYLYVCLLSYYVTVYLFTYLFVVLIVALSLNCVHGTQFATYQSMDLRT
jgi:hypothetical protein